MKGITKASYRTFTEEPVIKKNLEAKNFIKDYGVDGEKLSSYSEANQIVHSRIYLLTAINKYLAGENKGLEEDVKNYKEILGEKED